MGWNSSSIFFNFRFEFARLVFHIFFGKWAISKSINT